MPRPSTTPSCEATPVLSASTRRTISAALGDGARLPRLVATSAPLEEKLHKLHNGDVLQRHWGRKALTEHPVTRLRWPLCPGAPGNGEASPAPSGVGTAGAPRTQWRAAPRCRLRVPPSAGWRGPPPARSADARADRR